MNLYEVNKAVNVDDHSFSMKAEQHMTLRSLPSAAGFMTRVPSQPAQPGQSGYPVKHLS